MRDKSKMGSRERRQEVEHGQNLMLTKGKEKDLGTEMSAQ